jgi:hypothetical protein
VTFLISHQRLLADIDGGLLFSHRPIIALSLAGWKETHNIQSSYSAR